jgi:hypothetical protein
VAASPSPTAKMSLAELPHISLSVTVLPFIGLSITAQLAPPSVVCTIAPASPTANRLFPELPHISWNRIMDGSLQIMLQELPLYFKIIPRSPPELALGPPTANTLSDALPQTP